MCSLQDKNIGEITYLYFHSKVQRYLILEFLGGSLGRLRVDARPGQGEQVAPHTVAEAGAELRQQAEGVVLTCREQRSKEAKEQRRKGAKQQRRKGANGQTRKGALEQWSKGAKEKKSRMQVSREIFGLVVTQYLECVLGL